MLREYAVDPDAIYRNLDTLHRFVTDFNAENGRVVSAIPRKWLAQQKNLIKGLQLGPVAKTRVLGKLEKINDVSLINGYTIPAQLVNWIDQALHVKNGANLNAIISTQVCAQNQIYDYANMFAHEPNNWEIDKTISVQRVAADMANAISHSLRLATCVYYVDPYFTPSDNRFVAPLMAFIQKIQQGKTKIVTIHTTDKNCDRAGFINGLNLIIKPLLPTGFTLKLFIWQRPQIHDRYILTKNVGYSFGHGLDEAEYAAALNVNIDRLGESARKEQFRYFSAKDDLNDNVISVTGQ